MADSETREAEDIGMTEFEPPPPEEGYSFPFSRRKDSLEPKEDAAKPTPYPKVLMIIIVVMCVFLLVLLAALVVVVVLYLDAQDVVREVPTSTRMTTTEEDHDTSRGTSTATAKTTTSSTRPSSTVTETRSTPGGMTGIATTEVSLPEISPDEPFPLTVPAGDFDYFTMDLVGDSDVELAFEDAGSDVTVAVYGRLGEKPTHVEYDVVKTLVSERSRKRAIVNDRIKIEFENLLAGHWVFGIFNGDEEGLDTTMEIAQSPSPIRCPLDCSGRGQCDEGVCSCIEGWRGIDCGQVAPVPCSPEDCSGHGYFRDNICNCYDGWKGDKCQLADCIPSDCNGNGQCVDAVCQCHQGWTGTTCERVDCIPSDCNGNGHCVNGECRCYQGWQGQVCTTPYRPCPSDCSRHGNCNNVTGLCTCYGDWTEPDCSELSCEESCSGLGICYNGTCDCYSGWTGPLCRDRACIGGCGDNGICQNGTCTCNRGWSGSACQTNSCPNSCHGNGDCVLISEVWQCVCHNHFRGVACSIGIESTCDDGIDNDKDTLIDCDDPDCCNTTDCVNDVSCMFSPSPEDFVKTNVSATQNFYDQVAFLFLDSGIQQDAEVDFLREDLVSVLRGSVTSRDSSPLQGVTISVHGFPQYGYTMTRQDGGYEIAVNGGGVLTINFNRKNFIGAQRSIQISVNQYVAVEGVVLLAVDQKVTVIDLESDEIQVAEGSVVEDAAGKRKGVIMFHPGTEATIVSNNGTDNETVYQPHIRVTEYTVGESGEEAMPAVLPPFTGYTYAMELSMDEASVNGTTDVFFNQTVYYYVENYLGFPVGSAVPTGYYNRTLGEWVASVNGLVIEILPPSDADSLRAGVDVTGGKVNATEEELLNLGFNDQELLKLNALYAPGETLWRVPIPHFTPWDCNWPYGPPDCGCTPGECDPGKPPPKDDCEEGSTTPPKEPPPPPDPCGGGGGPGDGGPGDGGPGDGGPGDGGPGDGGPGDDGPGDGDGEGDSGSDGGGDSSPPSDSPPEVPRIPDIPSVPNVPPVPGVPPSPGSPPSPGVPLPSRPIVIPTQQWVSHFPSIPITVNPGHFGPNLPVTPIVNDTESDDDLRTKRSDETLQPGGSFKVPDLSRNPGSMAVSIPGTALQLVYNHNRQAGYKSLIKVPLTGNTVPDIMENVIMEVTVAGKKVTRDVKPGLHVTESVAWDGKDGYSRTVKGGAKAKVKIGYKYQMVYYPVRSEFTRSFNRFSQANTRAQVARGDRSVVYWEERELDVVRGIAGGTLGGWSLSIHHSYDANSGTLHMGSGETLRYTDQSAVLETVAGSDSRAAIDCRTCGEGLGKETRLRLPVALATSPDGSVYFGDYNFIRRIWPNGTVSTVLQLLQTRPKQTYYLATSRRDGALYMSDSARRQVLRIDPDTGEETVLAGTGERCAPWEDGCGDGGLATKAKLTVPKGIAVGKDGDIFLVDNRRIRQIGNDGVIEAHIGTNVIGQSSAERSRDLYDAPMKEISFTWPTDIAVHPEEDTLYIVDGDVIFKLSRQGRVRPVIGRSPVRGPTFPPRTMSMLTMLSTQNSSLPEGLQCRRLVMSTLVKLIIITSTVFDLLLKAAGFLSLLDKDPTATAHRATAIASMRL
ncbi:teneurin-3-like [Ptychodera flava]|uniref:teneurin-3-like n=1 Tax=Ptychodera flava TaxID=63121 RepID=UPI00396AA790